MYQVPCSSVGTFNKPSSPGKLDFLPVEFEETLLESERSSLTLAFLAKLVTSLSESRLFR